MAELTPADVAQYTSNRLDPDADETARLLSAGLTAARRFCGWHVTGVRTGDVVTMDGPSSALDGPGSPLLVLPTLRLVTLTGVVEDGVTLDVAADLYVSPRGLVRKRSRGVWSQYYGAITVTMDHGFDDADDFNTAVLSWVDRSSLAPSGGRPKGIGPFQFGSEAMAAASAFSAVERSLLDQYRLESAP